MKARLVFAAAAMILAAIALGYAHRESQTVFAPTEREASGDPFVGRDGASEAQVALSRGKMVMVEYGLYLPWDDERHEIAREKFGFEYRVLAGCVVTEPLVQFVAAYNRVMEQAIFARFGNNVFDIVNREGKALHEERWSKKEAAEIDVRAGKQRSGHG